MQVATLAMAGSPASLLPHRFLPTFSPPSPLLSPTPLAWQEYTANTSTMQYLRDHDVDTVWDTFHACGAERLQPAGSDGWGADEAAGEGQGWWALDEEEEEEGDGEQEEEQQQKRQEREGGGQQGGARDNEQGAGSEDEQEEQVPLGGVCGALGAVCGVEEYMHLTSQHVWVCSCRASQLLPPHSTACTPASPTSSVSSVLQGSDEDEQGEAGRGGRAGSAASGGAQQQRDGEQAEGVNGELNAAGRPKRAAALRRKLPAEAPEDHPRTPGAAKRKRQQQMQREAAVAAAAAAAEREAAAAAAELASVPVERGGEYGGGGAKRQKTISELAGTVFAGSQSWQQLRAGCA